MLFLAEVAPAAHHYTVWENVGYTLLLLGAGCLFLCYRFAFKTKAKCMVIRPKSKKSCTADASVVLGCDEHRWGKPVACFRHLGAARWLDPWLSRFHIIPASFAPMPMPVVRAAPAGSLLTATATAPPLARSGMSPELKVASWSLFFGIIQSVSGVIALAIAA